MSGPEFEWSAVEVALRAFISSVVRSELKLTKANPRHDEYLSTADAAQIARVTPGTVRRWVRGKQLAKHGTGPRVRIKRVDLESYLRGEVVESPGERAIRRFGRPRP